MPTGRDHGAPGAAKGLCGWILGQAFRPPRDPKGEGRGGGGADVPGSAAGNDLQTRRVGLGSDQGDGPAGGEGTEDVAPGTG